MDCRWILVQTLVFSSGFIFAGAIVQPEFQTVQSVSFLPKLGLAAKQIANISAPDQIVLSHFNTSFLTLWLSPRS